MAKEKEAKKENRIDQVVESINTKYGEGTIFRLGEKSTKVPVIPTGILGLDVALGVGGLPLGKVVEIYGPGGSGKSSLALSTAAQAQKLGHNVAFIDVEYALNVEYAAQIGVDVDSLYVSQPDSAEHVFEVMETLIESSLVGMIVVDSVDAMVATRELESDYGDSNVGIKAKLMSQALRRLKAQISKANVCVVFINQTRDQIGVMGYGDTSITTGGKALSFYADVRLAPKRIGQIKSGEDVVGHKTKVTVTKNKVAAPMKNYAYEVIYGEAGTLYGELVDYGVEAGFVTKGGAWFTYEDKKWQGKEKMKEALREDEALRNEVEQKVRGWLGLDV